MKRQILFAFFLLIVFVCTIPQAILSQNTSLLMREGDAFWKQRGEVDKIRAALYAYKKVLESDADNYEANWKIARAYFYSGGLLLETKEMREQHKEMGTQGMRYAKKALELNPQGIEGHYYYALCLAQYCLGISIFKILAEDLAHEFEKHIGEALKINKLYENAGPLRAVGRYWYLLPWPKRDIKKSIRYLEEAVMCAPTNVLGHVYLAESYLKAGKKELAKEHLQKALEITPDLTHEADAKRWQKRAAVVLKEKF